MTANNCLPRIVAQIDIPCTCTDIYGNVWGEGSHLWRYEETPGWFILVNAQNRVDAEAKFMDYVKQMDSAANPASIIRNIVERSGQQVDEASFSMQTGAHTRIVMQCKKRTDSAGRG